MAINHADYWNSDGAFLCQVEFVVATTASLCKVIGAACQEPQHAHVSLEVTYTEAGRVSMAKQPIKRVLRARSQVENGYLSSAYG